MPTLIIRLLRYAGWVALLASCGVVVGTVIWEAAGGLEAGQHLWPTPRLWRYFRTTLWMSVCATVLALLLALPASFALVRARFGWQRQSLLALTVIPLVTMPSIYAYAWFLLSSSSNAIFRPIMDVIGWNARGAEPVQAAWVLATWLWPIPALVLSTSFRQVGAGAYRLACLDASPVRAFLRGALPVMRAPLFAACAMVFVLAAMDSGVPPLLNASNVWSVEMLASAAVAPKFDRPAAYMFWQSWPMLVTIGLLVIAALPGIRQMAGWADEPATGDTGEAKPSDSWAWVVAVAIAATVTLFPLIVFGTTMAGGRYTAAESFQAAWQRLATAGRTTLIVAFWSLAAAAAIGLAVLDETSWPRPLRWAATAAVAVVLMVAVLPPPIIGTTLVSFFSGEYISPQDRWNVYDHTPLVWVAAMLARFVFIPVCLMRLLNRRVPEELAMQAAADGASPLQRLAYARLPMLWRPLVASALVVGALTLSEIAATGLVQPPQWGGGSLAVYVDSQMHYGRHNQTIAMSIIMMTPAIAAAVVLPFLAGIPLQRRRGAAESSSDVSRGSRHA